MAAIDLNAILGGLSGWGQGLESQQQYRLRQEAKAEPARKRQAIVSHWKAAQGGDQDAQAALIAESPEFAGYFQAKPKLPNRQFNADAGGIIDMDTNTFTPTAGLTPKPHAPVPGSPEWRQMKIDEAKIGAQYGYHPERAPKVQYDSARGGIVNLETGTFTPLPGQAPTVVNPKVAAQTDKLRSSYMQNPDVKTGYDVAQSITGLRSAAADKTPAGDLAFIFRYMKMLDPGSVVREGEFAQVEKSQSIPEKIKVLAKKVATGERLSNAQRIQFLAHAEQIAKGQRGRVNNAMKQYGGIARRQGVDSASVALDPYEGVELGQDAPSDADLWEQLVSQGVSKAQATARVRARRAGRP